MAAPTLQHYNILSLADELKTWFEERFLHPILNIEGGWEWWIQIDFPAWLEIRYGYQLDFRREVGIYGNQNRVDWLINELSAEHSTAALEIKAQGHKYVYSSFARDVRIDIAKLNSLGVGYHKMVLTAVIDDRTLNYLTDNQEFIPITPLTQGVILLLKSWT